MSAVSTGQGKIPTADIQYADLRTTDLLDAADALRKQAWEVMDAIGLPPINLDEVAVLCKDDGRENRDSQFIMRHVGKEGVEFFNQATDQVHTQPFDTNYEVQYRFLHTNRGYRLELMRIASGISPLHGRYSMVSGGPYGGDRERMPFVHVSWKCPDEETYWKHVQLLREGGLLPGQMCTSQYGRFSYWRPGTVYRFGQSLVWLKPRVNLRDAPTTPSPQAQPSAVVPYRESYSLMSGGGPVSVVELPEPESKPITAEEIEQAMEKVRADWPSALPAVAGGSVIIEEE